VLTLEVGQGGKELSGGVRQIGENVFTTEILLSRTLDLGETTTLEYWITYRFPGNSTDPSERNFRRACMRHVENLDMRVEFHPDRLPSGLWWARWDGIEGEVAERERSWTLAGNARRPPPSPRGRGDPGRPFLRSSSSFGAGKEVSRNARRSPFGAGVGFVEGLL